jgi:hypothetical protein
MEHHKIALSENKVVLMLDAGRKNINVMHCIPWLSFVAPVLGFQEISYAIRYVRANREIDEAFRGAFVCVVIRAMLLSGEHPAWFEHNRRHLMMYVALA